MKWREYLNDEIDKTINSLNKAKTAIAENDAMGAGIWMGRSERNISELNRNAYHVIPETLDQERLGKK